MTNAESTVRFSILNAIVDTCVTTGLTDERKVNVLIEAMVESLFDPKGGTTWATLQYCQERGAKPPQVALGRAK